MFLHTSHVVLERGRLLAGLGGVEAQELSKSLAVLGVLVNAKLDVLAEGRVEFVELLTVFGDLVEELQGLVDYVLLDDLHDLVLLKSLTKNIVKKTLELLDRKSTRLN